MSHYRPVLAAIEFEFIIPFGGTSFIRWGSEDVAVPHSLVGGYYDNDLPAWQQGMTLDNDIYQYLNLDDPHPGKVFIKNLRAEFRMGGAGVPDIGNNVSASTIRVAVSSRSGEPIEIEYNAGFPTTGSDPVPNEPNDFARVITFQGEEATPIIELPFDDMAQGETFTIMFILESIFEPDQWHRGADRVFLNCHFGFCHALGDVNGDGTFNVLDIVALANCVLASNCREHENACTTDMNADGGYNVLDIVALANCVLAQSCSG